MRRGLLFAVPLVAISLSCGTSFPDRANHERLVVTRKDGNFGSPTARLPINFSPSNQVKIKIEARDRDGNVDTSFNGFVRVSIRPGTIYAVGSGADGRNVKLTNGVADDVPISVIAAYGDARI